MIVCTLYCFHCATYNMGDSCAYSSIKYTLFDLLIDHDIVLFTNTDMYYCNCMERIHLIDSTYG